MTDPQTAKPAKPAKRGRAAVDKARRRAEDAIDAGAHAVDSSPLAALAGAIAVGAVAAALIPATRRELAASGPMAERVRGAIEGAYDAAKAAGSEELSMRGLTMTAATSGLTGLISGIVTAAIAASSAAGDSMKTASPSKKPAKK